MLSNAYFLAKFRFDTAENEPAKNLQNFRKMHFRKMANIGRHPRAAQRGLEAVRGEGRPRRVREAAEEGAEGRARRRAD